MRIRPVLTLHTVNRMQSFGWPLVVVGIALAIVIMIGVIAGGIGPQSQADLNEGMRFNGAIFTVLGPMIGYGFVSMGQYFPLALGMGLTRREFAAGVSLLFLVNAVAYTLLVTVGKVIERATDGFGVGVRFFDVVYTSTGTIAQTLVQTFLLILLALFLGAAVTVVYLRFGQTALWTGGITLAVLAVAVFAGVVYVDGFGSRLLELLGLSWGAWMGIAAAVTAVAAAVWLTLVRRTQVR